MALVPFPPLLYLLFFLSIFFYTRDIRLQCLPTYCTHETVGRSDREAMGEIFKMRRDKRPRQARRPRMHNVDRIDLMAHVLFFVLTIWNNMI